MSKRKQAGDPHCSHCRERGEVGVHTIHPSEFCGWPGGPHYNASNEVAGRQAGAQACYKAKENAKQQKLQQLGGVGAGNVAQFSAVVTQQATASSTAMDSLESKVESLTAEAKGIKTELAKANGQLSQIMRFFQKISSHADSINTNSNSNSNSNSSNGSKDKGKGKGKGQAAARSSNRSNSSKGNSSKSSSAQYNNDDSSWYGSWEGY